MLVKGSAGKCAVLVSGGIDSATVAALFAEERWDIIGLFVNFGQAALEEERRAVQRLSARYGVPILETSIVGIDTTPRIGGMPGRNALLVAHGMASVGSTVDAIAIGVHANSAYWDSGRDFVNLMQNLADGYFRGKLRISAPLVDWSKREIVAYARSRHVPLDETYSCDRSGGPCGECASCDERRDAGA